MYTTIHVFNISECTVGSFGPNCEHACGKCINNQVCDYRDGACPLGCAEGWTGDTCHIGKIIHCWGFCMFDKTKKTRMVLV